jgi:hypothetical protein
MADNQDNPGIRVPPPLIYLLPRTLRAASRQKGARPLLATHRGTRPRVVPPRKRRAPLEVVLHNDA